MTHKHQPTHIAAPTRRRFFEHVGAGFAAMAMASLVNEDLLRGALANTVVPGGVPPTDLAAPCRTASRGPRP